MYCLRSLTAVPAPLTDRASGSIRDQGYDDLLFILGCPTCICNFRILSIVGVDTSITIRLHKVKRLKSRTKDSIKGKDSRKDFSQKAL